MWVYFISDLTSYEGLYSERVVYKLFEQIFVECDFNTEFIGSMWYTDALGVFSCFLYVAFM